MKDIEFINEQLKKTIGDRLYRHCTNVMNTSAELAKQYNVPIEKAKIAGLLHDCGKLLNKDIGDLEHASLGVEIASQSYGIEDKEILDAIFYHTTGRENMTMLEKIVYLADKIEPDRNYENVDKIRELAYNDIDKAIIMSLENTLNYLKSINVVIDEATIKTLEYLKNNI